VICYVLFNEVNRGVKGIENRESPFRDIGNLAFAHVTRDKLKAWAKMYIFIGYVE